ncbi:MAG: hypothetical protein QHC90_30895 [Shinella sp.]|nr:hypothetical protein [Shinella sp.]
MNKTINALGFTALCVFSASDFAYAERVCEPIDNVGRACIHEVRNEYLKAFGKKYIGIWVTNRCQQTVSVRVYEKNTGGSFVSGVSSGRHQVTYCETAKCGGYSHANAICYGKGDRGDTPEETASEQVGGAKASKREKSAKPTKAGTTTKLSPGEQWKLDACIKREKQNAVDYEVHFKTRKIDYSVYTAGARDLMKEHDRGWATTMVKLRYESLKYSREWCLATKNMTVANTTKSYQDWNRRWNSEADKLNNLQTKAWDIWARERDAAWQKRKMEILDGSYKNGGSSRSCGMVSSDGQYCLTTGERIQ